MVFLSFFRLTHVSSKLEFGCLMKMGDSQEDVELPDSVSEEETGLCLQTKKEEETDIELPADVLSDEELDDHEELPEPIAGTRSCKLNCFGKFSAEQLDQRKLQQNDGSTTDIRNRKFEQIKSQLTDSSGNIQKTGHVKLHFLETQVCKTFWLSLRDIGHSNFDRVVSLVRKGRLSMLEKLPVRMPGSTRSRAQSVEVGAWFQQLYYELAEPLAESQQECLDLLEVEDTHPLWQCSLAVAGPGETRKVPVRYLNPGTVGDLYLQYSFSSESGKPASESTFLRVWNLQWKKYIRFRNVGQGKRRKVCAQTRKDLKQLGLKKSNWSSNRKGLT